MQSFLKNYIFALPKEIFFTIVLNIFVKLDIKWVKIALFILYAKVNYLIIIVLYKVYAY